MQQIILTDTYSRITPEGTGVCVIQGSSGVVFLGTTAPTANSPGLALKQNWPIPIDVAKFTHVWVKGTGVVRFAG